MVKCCTIPVFVVLLAVLACSSPNRNAVQLPWSVDGGTLRLDGQPVLTGLPDGMDVAAEGNTSRGVFLSLRTGQSENGYFRWTGMHLAGMERFTALYRELPWWMVPLHGSNEAELPLEVQCLLWRRADGKVGLILPLIDKGYRMNAGGADGALMLTADNNMPAGETGIELRGAYIALGDDPYAMLDSAFAIAVHTMGLGRLRAEKTPPRWIETLGWCTWNSFYHAVTHQGVLDGLKSFEKDGTRLGWLVLDDGWQQAVEYGFFEEKTWLTGLAENREKFPQGLAATVSEAREKYGVADFLVWQTFQGYWHGIDTSAAEMKPFRAWNTIGKSNRPLNKSTQEWVPLVFNAVVPEDIKAFFTAYHGWLAAQGVTGVKVDNQSHLEFMTYGAGPLADVMGAYKRALESSVDSLFSPGSVINCMGLGSDALFQAMTSSVTRNSNDYFPDQPETHGQHLTVNAYNSLMTGQLVLPDWDMFKSGHAWGAYHASARAISGGPVYLSDRPGEQDSKLLARISLPDGRVLRCPTPALPTPDILFRDPQSEDVALKIFNRNLDGAWVLGAWNCRWDSLNAITVQDTLSVSLIQGIPKDGRFAVWSFSKRELSVRDYAGRWPLSLGQREFEVCTVALIDRGVAPLGRTDMYNSAGIFESFGWQADGSYMARITSGGRISFYCQNGPSAVTAGGAAVAFEFDPANGLLVTDAPGQTPVNVIISF